MIWLALLVFKSNKVCFDLKSHVPSLGILIQHFNWRKDFQFSSFNHFITELAFGSLKTENASYQVKSLRDEKYHSWPTIHTITKKISLITDQHKQSAWLIKQNHK